MDFKPEHLLGDAIEAARRALRDLDADQVPASLRRVVGYAGGTLPPPFARSLLAELEVNEFLRSKALQAWQGESPPAGDRPRASYRFLEQGEGWLMEVVGAAFAFGARSSVAGDRTLEIERDAHEAEAASLKERLKASQKESKRIEGELREARRASQEPVREERATERRLAEALDETKRAHAAEVERLESRLAGVEGEVDSAREAARLDRRLRAEAEAAHRAAVASETPSMDPDALAEQLDVIATLAVTKGPGSGLGREMTTPPAGTVLRYPGEIRPDSAEAVDWLVRAGAATVFVDGYNLGFLLAGRLDPARARTLVVEAVGRLDAAARGTETVVVFDSEIEAGEAAPQRSGSVDIVYSSGRSADDEIVDRVGRAGNAVVITNDRDLRQRAEALGAITLWTDALAEWSRRR